MDDSVVDMETNACKAVQAHGFPGVEPAPGGLVHCCETAVPPGHSAPAGQVESVWLQGQSKVTPHDVDDAHPAPVNMFDTATLALMHQPRSWLKEEAP